MNSWQASKVAGAPDIEDLWRERCTNFGVFGMAGWFWTAK
jgi:hypothetical protein